MKHKITIDKNAVYENVYAYTAMTGKNKADMSTYAATPDNIPVLDKYFTEGLGVISSNTESSIDGDSILFDVPSNWDTMLSGSLSKSCENFLSKHITSMWFSSLDQDLYKINEAESASLIVDIKRILNVRRRPR